jgi:hypothetical protein
MPGHTADSGLAEVCQECPLALNMHDCAARWRCAIMWKLHGSDTEHSERIHDLRVASALVTGAESGGLAPTRDRASLPVLREEQQQLALL